MNVRAEIKDILVSQSSGHGGPSVEALMAAILLLADKIDIITGDLPTSEPPENASPS